jgi:hypothetical protein
MLEPLAKAQYAVGQLSMTCSMGAPLLVVIGNGPGATLLHFFNFVDWGLRAMQIVRQRIRRRNP